MKKFIAVLAFIWIDLHANSDEISKLKTFDINGIDVFIELDKGRAEITAEKSYLVNDGTEILFERPLVLFVEKDNGMITTITAMTATQDISSDEIRLAGNVIINSPTRKMEGEFFRVNPRENYLFSDNNPVKIEYLYEKTDKQNNKKKKREEKKENAKIQAGNLMAQLFLVDDVKQSEIIVNNKVKFTNPDGVLKASKASFFFQDDELIDIVATGSPVVFDGMIEDGTKENKKKKTHIEARNVKYIVKRNLVILKDNAVVKSEDGASITGDEITYNNKTGEMTTKNNKKKKTTIYLENIEEFQNEIKGN